MEITQKLENFGLTERQAKIYFSLLNKGVQSPLELSKITNINRTTVYRELADLQRLGLVEEIVEPHRTRFSATNPQTLQLLIAKKESEIQKLKLDLPALLSQIPQIPQAPPNTKVIYFRGKSGLQQLLWNTLRAKDEVVGYGYADWNKGVGKEFAEKLRQEYVERGVYGREIQNFTPDPYTQNTIYLTKYFQIRFIPKTKLEIKHDTYIYNDIFAFYSFYQGEMFGVEIHNAEIAKTQKQIFNILWKQAKA